jgi:hypothetical protein
MAIPPTFLTSDTQHFGLADEIAEDDCAIAGHGWKLAPKLAPNKDERRGTEAMVTGFMVRTLSQTMSAFGGKADMTFCAAHVRF